MDLWFAVWTPGIAMVFLELQYVSSYFSVHLGIAVWIVGLKYGSWDVSLLMLEWVLILQCESWDYSVDSEIPV